MVTEQQSVDTEQQSMVTERQPENDPDAQGKNTTYMYSFVMLHWSSTRQSKLCEDK